MIYLTTDELLHVATKALGEPPQLADAGLLESAAARPQATVMGAPAYPTLADKAAALTHSLARNHALVDGNKRFALSGLIVFLGVNGHQLTYDNDGAYELVMAIAAGHLNSINAISAELQRHINARTPP